MKEGNNTGNSSPPGKSRSSFSGKLGYVLAVAGSAVGLGNIWRMDQCRDPHADRALLQRDRRMGHKISVRISARQYGRVSRR